MTYMQNGLAFAGGIQELTVDEIGYVNGGSVDAPPGSPLLGINNWIPDSLENWYYDRDYGGGGMWFKYEGWGVYSAWDEDGDEIGNFAMTTKDKATNTLKGESSAAIKGLGSSSGGEVYLRPLGQI